MQGNVFIVVGKPQATLVVNTWQDMFHSLISQTADQTRRVSASTRYISFVAEKDSEDDEKKYDTEVIKRCRALQGFSSSWQAVTALHSYRTVAAAVHLCGLYRGIKLSLSLYGPESLWWVKLRYIGSTEQVQAADSSAYVIDASSRFAVQQPGGLLVNACQCIEISSPAVMWRLVDYEWGTITWCQNGNKLSYFVTYCVVVIVLQTVYVSVNF